MTIQNSRYQVAGLLGSGGQGTVHMAVCRTTGRRVAIKYLSDHAARVPAMLDAFRTEARLCLALSHPNLVAAIDADLDDPRPWVAFDLVEGTPLDRLVSHLGFLDPMWAASLALQTARGLAAAHAVGVVHRDVKPRNIMFAADGTVRLIDFGVAVRANLDDPDARQHPTGSWSGTVLYASPEQLQNRPLDGRSDLYALGLVLYEMLTGRRVLTPQPYTGMVVERANLLSTLPRPSTLRPDVPVDLDELIWGLLAFNPENRAFETATALADALEDVLRRHGAAIPELPVADGHGADEASQRHMKALDYLAAGWTREALTLLRSLVAIPGQTGERYRVRVASDLADLLFRLSAEARPTDAATVRRGLDELRAAMELARDAAHGSLLALAERQFLNLARDLSARSDELEAVRQLMALFPSRLAVGRRVHELLGELGRNDAARRMASLLSALCREHAWPEGACILAGGHDSRLATAEASLDEARHDVEEALERNQPLDALTLTLDGLALHPYDPELHLLRARAETLMGAADRAQDAHLEAARLLFERGDLARAADHLRRILAADPACDLARAMLVEAQDAIAPLPALPELRMVTGLVLARAEASALALLATTTVDPTTLPELRALAATAGCRSVVTELDLRGARQALDAGDFQGARELIAGIMDGSSDSLGVIRRILAFPGLRRALSPLALLTRVPADSRTALLSSAA